MKARPFPARTVVFAKIGEGLKSNRFRVLTRDTLIDNNMMGALPNEEVEPAFLLYLLQAARLPDHAAGSALPYLRASDLVELCFAVPAKREQVRIASVLGALDDKIDSNGRLAGLLEETAATVFRSRFVEFTGVEAFDESAIGAIPCGWSAGQLIDLVSFAGGKRPPHVTTDGAVPVLGANGPMGFCSEPLFAKPVVTVGRVGACGEIHRSHGPCWASDNTIVARPGDGAGHSYLYYLLKSIDFRPLITGTTQPLVTQRAIKRLPVVVPPLDQRREYEAFAQPVTALIDGLDSEAEVLRNMRDALLPKLISGQIYVPDTSDPDEVIGSGAERLAAATP